MTGCVRWQAFTNEELALFWDALSMEDGIRYGIQSWDQPEYGLLREILAEAQRRELTLSGDDWVLKDSES